MSETIRIESVEVDRYAHPGAAWRIEASTR